MKVRDDHHRRTRRGLLRWLAWQLDFYHQEALVDGISRLPTPMLGRLEREWRLAHGRRGRRLVEQVDAAAGRWLAAREADSAE